MIENGTIAAIATPHGHAGIAVIRISGKKALDIGRAIIRRPAKKQRPVLKHGAALACVVRWNGEIVDQAVATTFVAPRSYTGEDTVEISCHGSPVIAEKVLRCAIEAGARPAGPGEFTRRAFLNNKMDLVQAEAVGQLIHADSEQSRRIAFDHLQGTLSRKYAALKERLLALLCAIDASIDFPEDDVPVFKPAEGLKELSLIQKNIRGLIESYQTGKKISQGMRVAIIGPPNAGKSSLLNALCEKERVIVHEHPGTTRDTVEETIAINGVKITLIDTAGIRKRPTTIEAQGIARAQEAAAQADLSLMVFDVSQSAGKNPEALFAGIKTPDKIIVYNKADLAAAGKHRGMLVSAKTGEGVSRLKTAIVQRTYGRASEGAQAILVSERQRDLLVRMSARIDACMQLLKSRGGEELYAIELHEALRLLGAMTGEISDDHILNAIFASFCIGK